VIEPNHDRYQMHATQWFWVRDGLITNYRYIGARSADGKDFMGRFAHLLDSNTSAATLPKVFVEE
jgi:hypothetical protein